MGDDTQQDEKEEDAGGVSDDALEEVFGDDSAETGDVAEADPLVEKDEVSLEEMAEEEEGGLEEGFDDVDNF